MAAGMTRLPYLRFALYEAPAALAWSAAYAVGGYLLADQLETFEWVMQRFGWAVGLAVGAFITWKFWLQPVRSEKGR
jgi:membrane protein DedA with SNARE-associated domain